MILKHIFCSTLFVNKSVTSLLTEEDQRAGKEECPPVTAAWGSLHGVSKVPHCHLACYVLLWHHAVRQIASVSRQEVRSALVIYGALYTFIIKATLAWKMITHKQYNETHPFGRPHSWTC